MDPTDLGSGTATWLGGTGITLAGCFLWLRKFLSKDAADRAMDNADIFTLRRLNELLDSERVARKEAEARADQFAKERNELAAAVGRMEAEAAPKSPQRNAGTAPAPVIASHGSVRQIDDDIATAIVCGLSLNGPVSVFLHIIHPTCGQRERMPHARARNGICHGLKEPS